MHYLGVFRIFAVVLVERFFAREIAIDPEPVHGAAVGNLQLADDRAVVLSLTRNHARAATGADIKIDNQSPLLRRVQRGMRVK